MIKAVNIEKSYNNEKVLKGISLEIKNGEFVSIMGESGSGKSTLLSIIGGFLPADSGKVFYDGDDISKLSESKMSDIRCTQVGFVFQSFKLIPTLDVKDNLLLPTILGKKANKETYEYLSELIKEVGISHLLSKYPDQLSGGQCQRVAIVRALLYRPSTVILDEPTGALDSAMEERVMRLLSKTNKEYGTTIIQVTHSKRVAEYGNRIIYIKDGKISYIKDGEINK